MDRDAGPVATGEWECMECGYVETGVKSKRPRECPECGAPSQALEFFPFGDDAGAGELDNVLLDDDTLSFGDDEDEDVPGSWHP